MEREAGRVFKGWKEGKIYFAPTYKYAFNSDTYYAEGVKVSKNKRRTPAWYVSFLNLTQENFFDYTYNLVLEKNGTICVVLIDESNLLYKLF
jgi:hypothetical protein